MTTIPERIREEAQRIAELANECCYRTDGYEENIREQVEQALLAAEKRGREEERERCARICDAGASVSGEMETSSIMEMAAKKSIIGCSQKLATLIRSTN